MNRRLTAILVAVCVSATAACTGDTNAGAQPSSATTPATSSTSAAAAPAIGKPTPTRKPKPKPKPPAVMPIRVADKAPMSTPKRIVQEMLKRTRSSVRKPVDGVSVKRLDRARHRLVDYLAFAHANRRAQCDPFVPDTAFLSLMSEYWRDELVKAENAEWARAVSFRLASQGHTCKGLSWQAPGIVVGHQRMRFTPGKGDSDVFVTYVGQFGYSFRTKPDNPELYVGTYRQRFGLDLSGRTVEIVSISAPDSWIYNAWPAMKPPASFAKVMSGHRTLPGASAKNWRTLQHAVRRTLRTPAATWKLTTRQRKNAHKVDHSSFRMRVALRRGDAVWQDPDAKNRVLVLDHGRLLLEPKGDDGLRATLGNHIPVHTRWAASDPTTRRHDGEGNPSPFVHLELLRLATSVRPEKCAGWQRKAHATTCLLARTPATNAAYSKGIATQWGWSALTHNHVWLDAHVGLDRRGRIVAIERKATNHYLDNRPFHYTWRATLSRFRGRPPKRPARPRAALIAKPGTWTWT